MVCLICESYWRKRSMNKKHIIYKRTYLKDIFVNMWFLARHWFCGSGSACKAIWFNPNLRLIFEQFLPHRRLYFNEIHCIMHFALNYSYSLESTHDWFRISNGIWLIGCWLFLANDYQTIAAQETMKMIDLGIIWWCLQCIQFSQTFSYVLL